MASNQLSLMYRAVLERVLEDNTRLPSLPDIAFKIRNAIAEENTTGNPYCIDCLGPGAYGSLTQLLPALSVAVRCRPKRWVK